MPACRASKAVDFAQPHAMRQGFVWFVVVAFAGMLQGASVDVTRMLFFPTVVPDTYTQPIRFEATITGGPSTVAFELNGVDRPMYDDGSHGDRVAGDGVWTIQFQPAEVIGKLTSGSVYRPFIGYCKPGGTTARYNIFAEVSTSAIPVVPVQAINATTQRTDYVVNFSATTADLTNFNPQHWAALFYALHGDKFDFLNFVLVGGTRGNRFHAAIKNDVRGIGSTIFDTTAQYGSGGRLKGYTLFPLVTMFDGGSQAFNHETGHQWIDYLSLPIFTAGRPHWPLSSLGNAVMGISIGGAGGAGGDQPFTFTANAQGGYTAVSTAVSRTFNGMELYLMGLAPTSEVAPFFVLNNQLTTLTNGMVLQASDVTNGTIADIVAAVGARDPDTATAPKAFRCAIIVLSEGLLDQTAMSLYDWFARRAEASQTLAGSDGLLQYSSQPFFLATSRRATMSSRLKDDPAFSAQATNQVVGAGQSATFSTGAGGDLPLSLRWQLNGADISGATAPALLIPNASSQSAGIYRALLSNASGTATSDPLILGVTTTSKVVGTGSEVGANIPHPNGNIYDQVLLQGPAATVTADPGQVVRISFIGLNDDIVQVEFGGAGSLSLVLDSSTGPAPATKYNQPTVSYMKGHAGIVIAGANETTNISVFSVGRATAVNQALFRSDVTYDGLANIAFIAISSTNGKFGGVRAANASFFSSRGLTGIFAPGVQFTGPVFVGDINAFDAASPVLQLGSASDVRITGGDLLQNNNQPVAVSGITQLKFVDGSTSHGVLLPAQANRARLVQNGVEVTNQIVVNPTP